MSKIPKILSGILIVFWVSNSHAQHFLASKPLTHLCGSTILIQFSIQLDLIQMIKVRESRFSKYFCEPEPPPIEIVNAQIIFLDKKGRTLWTRLFLISKYLNFDYIGKKGLSGGYIKNKQIVQQIKIPSNDETKNLYQIKIITDEGENFGPMQL